MPLDQLRTEREERDSNIELTGALQQCNIDKILALDHLLTSFAPRHWWEWRGP